MKTIKKDFDCVEMKNKIQEKLHKKRQEYSTDIEYLNAIDQELQNNPRFSKFYKNS